MKYFVILFFLISTYKLLHGQSFNNEEISKNLVAKTDDVKEQYGRPPYGGGYGQRQPYGQQNNNYGQRPYPNQQYNPYGGGNNNYGGYGYRPYGRGRWETTTAGFPFNLFGKK